MGAAWDEYHANNATADEISAIVGTRNWAYCRASKKRLERYDVCISRKRWEQIQKQALAARAKA